MRSSLRGRWLFLASVVLAVVPVTFGLIRAVSTGDDFRYLWLAGAAILGSMLAVPRRRGASGPAAVWLRRALGAVAAGTACAAATGIILGAKAGPGIAIVAISFGLCSGTSAVCAVLARHSPDGPV
jgi:hypothetical protein